MIIAICLLSLTIVGLTLLAAVLAVQLENSQAEVARLTYTSGRLLGILSTYDDRRTGWITNLYEPDEDDDDGFDDCEDDEMDDYFDEDDTEEMDVSTVELVGENWEYPQEGWHDLVNAYLSDEGDWPCMPDTGKLIGKE